MLYERVFVYLHALPRQCMCACACVGVTCVSACADACLRIAVYAFVSMRCQPRREVKMLEEAYAVVRKRRIDDNRALAQERKRARLALNNCTRCASLFVRARVRLLLCISVQLMNPGDSAHMGRTCARMGMNSL